jgi:hypothetical protein
VAADPGPTPNRRPSGAGAAGKGGARSGASARPEPGPRGTVTPFDPETENYYQLLNVPYTADLREITRAYREAMKRAHPDRHPVGARRQAAEEQAKLLNTAYATLSKPTRRQAYDQTLRGRMVQDQVMSRYVGGAGGPAAGASDPFARGMKRPPTAAQRRDQRRSDRSALVSLVIVFGGITAFFVASLLLYSVARFLVELVF